MDGREVDAFLLQVACPICKQNDFNTVNELTGFVECDNPPCRYERALARVPVRNAPERPAVLSGRWNRANARKQTRLVERLRRKKIA